MAAIDTEFRIYSYYSQRRWIPIQNDVRLALINAMTPMEMEKILADNETRIAQLDKRNFLDCDEAANLMSAALRARKIPHIEMVGTSDEGSSHAFVVVDGVRYDPTHQGYGDGKIYCAMWWPEGKEFRFPDNEGAPWQAVLR